MRVINSSPVKSITNPGFTVRDMKVDCSYKSSVNEQVVSRVAGGWIMWASTGPRIITDPQNFASFHGAGHVWYPHDVEVHIA